MTGPNMAAITASLERSLQNFSLNNNRHQNSSSSDNRSSNSTGGCAGGGGGGISRTSSSDLRENNYLKNNEEEEATLELNSHVSLPYHWEQCLDLKTGELYYINWRTGMRAKEDPRMTAELSGEFHSEDDSSYDTEGSSTESSPSSWREKYRNTNNSNNKININVNVNQSSEIDHVLVVAGCKSCFMYFMVPKSVEDCPKCCGQLLHFDK